MPGVPATGVLWINAIALNDQGTPAVIWADANGVHITGGPALPLPRGTTTLSFHAIAGADLNYDFKTDLIIASA